MMNNKTTGELMLTVSEQFYSLQGEGPTAGFPAFFLRLSHCNLLCGGAGTQKDGELHNGATWRCDTIEVWQKGQNKTFEQILKDFGSEVNKLATREAVLVITGGEPLMHQKQLEKFIPWLEEKLCKFGKQSIYVEVETNGTIKPTNAMMHLVNQWNVSPKLKNSGMREQLRINIDALQLLNKGRTCWKFVTQGSEEDFNEIKKDYLPHIKKASLYLMPAVDNAADYAKISQKVAKLCIQKGLRYSPRLHVAIWDKKTGV